MARTALIVKTRRRNEAAKKAAKSGGKSKMSTRNYQRCSKCGRNGRYDRHTGLCHICFRELARAGRLPGIRKASW